jgi:hypothetical protein
LYRRDVGRKVEKIDMVGFKPKQRFIRDLVGKHAA